MDAQIVRHKYTGVAAGWNEPLTELDEANLAELTHETELGTLNLATQVDKLRVIREIVGSLDGQDERWLHSGVVVEIGARLGQVLELRNRMRDFTLGDPDPEGIRRGIDGELEGQRNWFAQNVTSLGQPNIPSRHVASELERELKDAKEKTAEIAALLADVRTQAGATAASTLSGRYQEQAATHRTRAGKFLIAGIVALIGTLAVVWYFTVVEPIRVDLAGENAWVEFARQLLPRAFAIGAVSAVVAFAARNYRVSMHLATINENKVNALDTYTLFTEAVTSETARDAMVVEVIRAVVTHPDTGYLGSPDKTVIETGPGSISSWIPPKQ